MTIINSSRVVSSSRRIYSITVLAIFAVLVLFITASIADITEIEKLVPSDGAYADYFGSSVSISGEYAIVGAPSADTTQDNAGAAYIFERSGNAWNEITPRLVPDNIWPVDLFGSSVSIAGETAIVGKIGAAYVFRRSEGTWTQEQELTVSGMVLSDYFGTSVSIAADYAIVGAPNDDDNGSNSGSAFIFERSGTTWTQVAKLTADDGEAGDGFGTSVAISGNYAIVGAPFDDVFSNTDAGSVYFYRRVAGTWKDEQKLVDNFPIGYAGDRFGWSVAIYGETAVIGAYEHDDDSVDGAGSATIAKYWNNAWVRSSYLMASDRAAADNFGYSVSISANYVIVGAFNADGLVDDSGAAYVFRKTSGDDILPSSIWEQMAKLIASDGAGYDRFGVAVSISGPDALVGAKWDNNSAGSAYIFNIFGDPVPLGAIPGIPILLLDK